MAASQYQIRLCDNLDCRLRYPVVEGHPFGYGCPNCGGDTHIVHTQELVLEPEWEVSSQPFSTVSALLENIRSAWNVGSMMRTAESAGLRHVYLGGITPTPRSKKVLKTSLGSERIVPWSHHNNSPQLVEQLKEQGSRILALETSPSSESIFDAANTLNDSPLLLVVGNEVSGIDPEIIGQSDRLMAIPMRGYKKSLNVAVAFGIAVAVISNLRSRSGSRDL